MGALRQPIDAFLNIKRRDLDDPEPENIQQIRYANGRKFVETVEKNSIQAMAKRMDVKHPHVASKFGSGKRILTITRDFCLSVEKAYGVEWGWFDKDHSDTSLDDIANYPKSPGELFRDFEGQALYDIDKVPPAIKPSKKVDREIGVINADCYLVVAEGDDNFNIHDIESSIIPGSLCLCDPMIKPQNGDYVIVSVSPSAKPELRLFSTDGTTKTVSTINPQQPKTDSFTSRSKIYAVVVDRVYRQIAKHLAES